MCYNERMNTDKMRGYLYAALIILALIAAYAAVSFVGAYSSSIEPTSYRSFAVTADGKAIAVPDIAEFTFSVVTEGGKDLSSLQSQNTASTNGAIDFVKSEGVDSKDIQTSGYSISPRYEYSNCGSYSGSNVCPPPTIVGYTVTQSVDVKVRDFSKIGDILSGVVAKGANNVSSLNFTLDDPTSVEAEARAEAIKKAQVQADEIAKEGGFSVGRLLSIDESQNMPQPVYYNMSAKESYGLGGGPSAAPSIEAGSEEVRVSVTLRYEIK